MLVGIVRTASAARSLAGGEPGARIARSDLRRPRDRRSRCCSCCSFVLGIMYLVALRYVMLGGQGAFEAAGNAWQLLPGAVQGHVR